eukprot:2599772-Rhodomonas_salina.1
MQKRCSPWQVDHSISWRSSPMHVSCGTGQGSEDAVDSRNGHGKGGKRTDRSAGLNWSFVKTPIRMSYVPVNLRVSSFLKTAI